MKKILSLFLILALCLTSCGSKTQSETPADSVGSPKVNSDGYYEFYVPSEDEYGYIAEFADMTGGILSPCFYILNGLSAFDDYTVTDVSTNYVIGDSETEEEYVKISVKTAPKTQLEISRMDTTYFKTENYYNGQKKSTVEDFGNKLISDSIGYVATPLGDLRACYIEFENSLTKCDSIRFYMCDDQIDENYYGIMITADIPLDKTDAINNVRNCLGTLTFMQ